MQSPLFVSDELLDMMHLPINEFSVEEIGELAVKGRMEPIHLWRVAKRRAPSPILISWLAEKWNYRF